jgi:hypothetical protein
MMYMVLKYFIESYSYYLLQLMENGRDIEADDYMGH